MARPCQLDPQSRKQAAGSVQLLKLDRGYLTDGTTLFRVERTVGENRQGELLIELEDCETLELIVCPVHTVSELGMRPVQPLTPYPV